MVDGTSMAFRPRNRSKVSPNAIKAWGVCLILLGLLLYSIYFQSKQPEYDDAGCLKVPSAVTALLVDRSDPFSPRRQVADVQRVLEEVVDSLTLDERLSVYVLGDREDNNLPTRQSSHVSSSIAREKGRLCRPPLTPEESKDRAPWANKRYIERFETEKRGLTAKVVGEAPLKPEIGGVADSPILEYIQQVAEYLRSQPAARKRLIIISDLGQNVPGRLDICAPLPAFERFRATPYFENVRANLSGVTVKVYYIQRRGGAGMNCNARVQQGGAHQKFWRDYFIASGATLGEPLYRTLDE